MLEQLDDVLAGTEIVLSDETLDRIEIVRPAPTSASST
jgi:hypothetical protein